MVDHQDLRRETDLQVKRDARLDAALEGEARVWIEAVIQAPLGEGSFQEVLKDGTFLCELLNAIQPGTVKKFNKHPQMPFKQMENIGLYLDGCKALGVQAHNLFRTVDLFEAKDMATVTINLLSLGRAAQKLESFAGPHFGHKELEAHPRTFTEEQLAQARAEQTLIGKGSHGGATQAGTFDHSRDILKGVH